MEANEIMIGDLLRVTKDVCIKNGTIVRVRAIDADDSLPQKGLKCAVRCQPIDDIYGMNIGGVWLNFLEPIPLTTDILEKNGFKRHNRYQYIHKDNYCKVCVSIAPRIEIDGVDMGEPPICVDIEGALFDINISISAIHELQHALRLCGIDKTIEL